MRQQQRLEYRHNAEQRKKGNVESPVLQSKIAPLL